MVVAVNRSRERRPRRWVRWLALGGALLGLMLGLAYGFRDAWLAPLLVTRLRAEVRERFGAELSIEHVSGSWFEDLTLTGVRWRADGEALARLEEGRIELRYSLAKALRSEPDWLRSVSVTARNVELGLRSSAGGGQGAAFALPELDLDLGEVLLRAPGLDPLHLERVQARASLTPGSIEIESFEARAGGNRLGARAASLELGAPNLETFLRHASGELTLSLPQAQAFGWTRVLPVPLHGADLTLSARRGEASVTGELEWEGGSASIQRGALTLGEGAPLADLLLDLALTVELRDLAPLGRLVGQELAGRWSGGVDVTGPIRAPIGRFHGSGTDLRVAGVALDAVELDLETDGRRARVRSGHASGPAFETDLRGELELRPLALVDVALTVHATAPALAQLLPFPSGEAFLHAQLSGPPAAPRGEFEASLTGVELGRLRVDDAVARGRIAGDALEVDELRLTSGAGSVRASGTLRRAGDGFQAQLGALSVDWQGTRGELERGATLSFGPGRFAVEGLELRSEGVPGASDEPSSRAGRATISLLHSGGATKGSLEFVAFEPGALLAPWLPAGWTLGVLDGRVSGELGAGSAHVELDLGLEHGRLGAERPEFALSLRGESAEGRLVLDTLRARTADGSTALTGSLAIPFDFERPLQWLPGPVELALELEAPDALRSLELVGLRAPLASAGRAELRAELGGSWSALTGSVHLTAAALTLGAGKEQRTSDLVADLELGERLRIAELSLSAPDGRVTLSGEIALAADVPGLLQEQGALVDAPLALEAEVALDDIGWLAKAFPELRRISGAVAGHVRVHGTLIEPELGGALSWRAGELRLTSSSTPLRDLAAEVSLEGDVVRVDSLSGDYGGAPVTVTGTLEPFGPFPRLDLELAAKNLLLARSPRLHVRADATLAVKGTPDQLHIGGELALTEARYTGEIDPLKEILHAGKGGAPARGPSVALWRTGPLALATLDVHVGGTRTFDYETNLLTASVRPDAWLRGTGAFPTAEGPLYIESASVTLPSGKMEIVSGLLELKEKAPFQPDATLTATLRVQGYEVRASVTGPIALPEIVLSSTPPLAFDDLWILVLTGQVPTDRWQDRNQQAMASLAVFLARDSVVRWFSDESSSSNLSERIEIEVGTKTSESGQPTGRVIFYLRPRSARSGRATYISGEMDEHDRVNYALGIVFRPR